MNFQHLKAFCAIVAEGSFSRAAEELHLTQPTISAQIQGLEKHLGTRLLDRSAQGVSLTQAGKCFHPYALQLLDLATRAEEAVNELQELSRGRVEICASTVPGHYLLPSILAQFKQRYPGVELTLVVSNSQDVRHHLREGRCELGMVGEEVRDDRLIHEPVASDHLIVVMGPDHPLSSRKSITPQDLREVPLILREQGSATRHTLERALLAAGVSLGELKVHLELGSIEAIKMAVRSSDALAVVSVWTAREERRLGLLRAVPLEGVDTHRNLYLVRREHSCLSVAGETFVQFLKDRLADLVEPD